MSTYSPSLRVELLNTGTNAGTWGNTTNDNFSTVFDVAIAGYITVTALSANQALTYVNGPTSTASANESVRAALNLTTSTGADFAVYAPPVSKLYIIKNSSSYTATIYNSTVIGNTTAAGTGVAIPAGKTMAVWSDGTNFTQQTDHLISPTIATPAITSPTMSGTPTAPTAAAGTSTTQVATTAFVATSYAPLASPALTGTPTAPTATAGTNTTQVATTAFVSTAVTNATGSLGTMSTQNANNVSITGGAISGLSSLGVSGAVTATGTVTSGSSGVFVSPNSGTTGAVILRDAPGNPDAAVLQATNNGATVQYGYIKFNSNGTITFSGTIVANVSTAIGYNQTWQNVLASRAMNTTYTNSTSQPIMVGFGIGSSGATVIVGGVTLYEFSAANGNTLTANTFIVPPGATYRINGGGLAYWAELRA